MPVGDHLELTYMLLKLHSNQSNCSKVRLMIGLFEGGGVFYCWNCLELLAQKCLSVAFIIVLNSLQTMQPHIACMQYGRFHPWEAASQEEYGPGFSSYRKRPQFCSHLLSTSQGCWLLSSAPPLSH